MDSRELLVEARQLVAEGWTQSAFVRWPYGKVHYCLVGALRKVAFPSFDGYEEAALLLCRTLPDSWSWGDDRADGKLMDYNDNSVTTQKDVLALFDRAIASVPDQGGES